MSKKFNKSLNLNYLSSNVSFGSISATTFTGGNLSISGNIFASTSVSSASLYGTNITGTNIVGTTISTGSILIRDDSIFENTKPSNSSSEASVIVKGGISIRCNQNSVNVGNGGGLTVVGGGSFGGDLWVGGSINGSGSSSSTYAYLTLTATDEAINLSTGSLVTLGGITTQLDTNSTSVTNGGALLVAGGASIVKDVYIGGNINIGGPVLKIPIGNIISRPSAPESGYVRYNSETQQFEGYGPGNAWGSLGGVIDISQTTKILASRTPSTTDGNLYFFTVNNERMRINSAGNIGIGTSSPSTTLDVIGTARFTTSVSSGGLFGTNASVGGLNASGLSAFVNTTATNVSVGVLIASTGVTTGSILNTGLISSANLWSTTATVPNIINTNISTGTINATGITISSAQITNVVSTNISSGTINLSTGVTSASAQITNANVTTSTIATLRVTSNLLALGNSNTMGSIITTGGNIGIGIVSPACALDISNGTTSSNAPFLRLGNSSGGTGNKVGIRLNPFSGRTGGDSSQIIALDDGGSSSHLLFYTADTGSASTSTERMRITNSGNVGIGTNNPTSKLYVSGDMFVTGDISAFSDIRLKSNIRSITNSLDKISRLQGVYYTHTETQKESVGLIAQETLKVLPEVVSTKGEYLGINYGNIVGLLVEGIKEIHKELQQEKQKSGSIISENEIKNIEIRQLMERISLLEDRINNYTV